MNEDEARIQQHHGGPSGKPGMAHQPAWKRMHRSPFFWAAAVCILAAMAIFVLTDGFALRPAGAAVPAPQGP
jgi:hypothetical protein